MKPISLGAVLGAATLALTPMLASAAPTTYGGIELRSAEIQPSETDLWNDGFMNGSTAPHVLRVSFVNTGNVPATDIQFALTGLKNQIIDDTGKFAPNVVVNQQFYNAGTGGDDVQIVGVRFADGTSWSANQAPAPLRQEQETEQQ